MLYYFSCTRMDGRIDRRDAEIEWPRVCTDSKCVGWRIGWQVYEELVDSVLMMNITRELSQGCLSEFCRSS